MLSKFQGKREVFLLASLLSFEISIPIACFVAPLVGLYDKNDPKLYQQRINR